MKIIACNSNKFLAEAITSYIGVKLADAVIRKFADGEIFVKINENTYLNNELFYSHRRATHEKLLETGRMINIISFR